MQEAFAKDTHICDNKDNEPFPPLKLPAFELCCGLKYLLSVVLL